jgi:bifunctional UDP-N-acetylglucosamine pyrophosphorylase/glucosamine-1-phosphate N-acetyltransferase
MLQGVNDRWQLAQAAAVLRRQICKKHAMAGVSIIDPSNTYIGLDVEIGANTVIQPMCTISGKTVIGENCEIGPSSNIIDASIADGCTVLMSQVNRATMKAGSRIGPFSNLRPGAVLGEDAKVGNFVEIKNSEIGMRVCLSHLTYIGDASIGNDTNIGAGTITCNYDGVNKNKTKIGDRVFIGSDTMLIAPIEIGNDAYTGAGSVINRNLPSDALGIERSPMNIIEGWAKRKNKQRKENHD